MSSPFELSGYVARDTRPLFVAALKIPPYVEYSQVSAALDAEFIHVPDA